MTPRIRRQKPQPGLFEERRHFKYRFTPSEAKGVQRLAYERKLFDYMRGPRDGSIIGGPRAVSPKRARQWLEHIVGKPKEAIYVHRKGNIRLRPVRSPVYMRQVWARYRTFFERQMEEFDKRIAKDVAAAEKIKRKMPSTQGKLISRPRLIRFFQMAFQYNERMMRLLKLQNEMLIAQKYFMIEMKGSNSETSKQVLGRLETKISENSRMIDLTEKKQKLVVSRMKKIQGDVFGVRGDNREYLKMGEEILTHYERIKQLVEQEAEERTGEITTMREEYFRREILSAKMAYWESAFTILSKADAYIEKYSVNPLSVSAKEIPFLLKEAGQTLRRVRNEWARLTHYYQ